ncbi:MULTISPECIES: hypothetical protein [unclassified Paraburkholderia]|uniref:hypothetical protein n=1 Tax=unclassified Paraburkholderia TaxID=2615204 RepID=UPI001F11C4F1|nr:MULTISPECIES: hypothetical protein [unclassified Paraburkholderia]
MRLIPSNVKLSAVSHTTALAAVLIPAALFTVAPSVYAQTASDAAGAPLVVASVNADVVPVTTAAVAVSDATDTNTSGAAASASSLSAAPLAADPVPAGDDQAVAGVGSIDDQTLSRQRGGAVGMLMVAATPQLMRGGNNVTLWDEIAPPAPLPIPVDSGQAAQGNIASYTRK